MIKKNETVSIAWCDSGTVDGKFTEGIVGTILDGQKNGMPIYSSIRINGNQIGRQRQIAFDIWADDVKSDWLLWVDSDIVLTTDVLKILWNSADSEKIPVLSGVYFISKEYENTVMRPFPCIFNDVSKYELDYIHPMPYNQIIKADCAGFGLVLMHKSIINKLRNKFPNESFFIESATNLHKEFISEDIVFFRKLKQAGVQLYVDTSAVVKHMKRFSLDFNYYNMYWSAYNRGEQW